ncbi:hypothetical protein MKX03_013462 [Papaver bracteatum]|nr:hypothetical protein MKX03_013462 [Papaver bracteatum]
MASIHGMSFPHMASIRAEPELSPEEEEEEERRDNLKLRDILISRKLDRMERSAKAAGRQFKRDKYKITGYDWLLAPPRELRNQVSMIPVEGSHCTASDPTKARASASQDGTVSNI